jgi:hypothetical protein
MNMSDIIRAVIFTPTPWGWGVPCLFTGAPGEGKSSVAAAVAEAHGMPYVLLSPGETGEAYFGAVPAVVGGVVDYPRPGWTDEVAVGGLVIVDELRTAPVVLRPALLGLTLDRRVGGHALGRDVAVIALSNSADDSPNGLPLDPPQANRFIHIPWTVMNGAETGAMVRAQLVQNKSRIVEGGLSDWQAFRRILATRASEVYAGVGAEIESFLSAHPQWARVRPKDGEGDSPWPSPRAWSLAACGMAAARLHGLGPAGERMLINGAVGAQAGAALWAHAAYRDLPSVTDLLTGRVTWNASGARTDQVAYMADAVMKAATAENCEIAFECLLGWATHHKEAVAPKIAAMVPTFKANLSISLARRIMTVTG